jgi:hypothetical protein
MKNLRAFRQKQDPHAKDQTPQKLEPDGNTPRCRAGDLVGCKVQDVAQEDTGCDADC